VTSRCCKPMEVTWPSPEVKSVVTGSIVFYSRVVNFWLKRLATWPKDEAPTSFMAFPSSGGDAASPLAECRHRCKIYCAAFVSWIRCVMSNEILGDPALWHKCARDARNLAAKMTNPEGKMAMLHTASSLDALARRALEKMKSTDANG
jgi:hypothetical protein